MNQINYHCVSGIGFKDDFSFKLKFHLKHLTPEDRYLRFFSNFNDAAIDAYVDSLSKREDDNIILIENKKDTTIIACLHLAYINETDCEIGFSVDENFRRQGLAMLMFEQSWTLMRYYGYKRAFMSCLHHNTAVQSLVKKFNAKITSNYDGKEAVIDIGGVTVGDVGLYDKVHRDSLNELNNLKK